MLQLLAYMLGETRAEGEHHIALFYTERGCRQRNCCEELHIDIWLGCQAFLVRNVGLAVAGGLLLSGLLAIGGGRR